MLVLIATVVRITHYTFVNVSVKKLFHGEEFNPIFNAKFSPENKDWRNHWHNQNLDFFPDCKLKKIVDTNALLSGAPLTDSSYFCVSNDQMDIEVNGSCWKKFGAVNPPRYLAKSKTTIKFFLLLFARKFLRFCFPSCFFFTQAI